MRSFLEKVFEGFPWRVEISDWEGQSYTLGENGQHWTGRPLIIRVHSLAAAKDVLSLNGLSFLERFVAGEIDLEGNLYALNDIQVRTNIKINLFQFALHFLKNRTFQSLKRARISVKSHYDIPQEALNIYLDRVYRSYSCGWFSNPDHLSLEELLRVGKGKEDDFDSLEKAQWRKFKDAVDFIAPKSGETMLDIGCGYGGQLAVALENHPFGKVVGWTLSSNQAQEGKKLLSHFEKSRWELNEGDYREDQRVYDHLTSTGMVSHVGPKGLIPYVKNIRKRVKKGGRYVHHSLMKCFTKVPLNRMVGPAFNKKYVWPGFHWFTLGEHLKALENNGFHIYKVMNLTPHYAKTTATWYERMMSHQKIMIQNLGLETFRAWQIYLSGASGAFINKRMHVCRIYCEAI